MKTPLQELLESSDVKRLGFLMGPVCILDGDPISADLLRRNLGKERKELFERFMGKLKELAVSGHSQSEG